MTTHRPDARDRLIDELAGEIFGHGGWGSELIEIQILRDGVRSVFENVDILVRPTVGSSNAAAVRWTVSVRAAPPDLDTWCTDWSEPAGSPSRIATRVELVREWATRMLRDHCRNRHEALS